MSVKTTEESLKAVQTPRMLTSALSFLSDKRRRFQRSDTMPVFTNPEGDTGSNVSDTKNADVLAGIQSVDQYALMKTQQTSADEGLFSKYNLLGQPEAKVDERTSFTSITDGQCLEENLCTGDPEENKRGATEPSEPNINLSIPLTMTQSSNSERSSNPYPHSKSPSPLSYGSPAQRKLSSNPSHSKTSEDSTGPSVSFRLNDSIDSVRCNEPDLRDTYKREPDRISLGEDQLSDSNSTEKMVRRVRAAAKAKLQRSNSTAQVSRQLREEIFHKSTRGRSTSGQRDVNEHMAKDETSTERKRRARRRVKTWAEKGPRSKSVASAGLKTSCPHQNASVRVFDLILQMTSRGTFENQIKIDTVKQVSADGVGGLKLGEMHDPIVSEIAHLQQSNFGTKLSSTASSNTHGKINRNAVVRRLRRNHSSLNWSSERCFRSLDAEFACPSSQTAGDLLIPLKGRENIRPENESVVRAKEQLLALIKRDDTAQLLQSLDQLVWLREELRSDHLGGCDDVGLSPVECALLVASPQFGATLLALGFQIGPILQLALNNGPAKIRLLDPLKFHLTRRIGDAEAQLVSRQTSLKTLIAKANSVSTATAQPSSPDKPQASSTNAAFAEVAAKEREMMVCMARRDYLVRLHNGIRRFPHIPPPPRKVSAVVSGPQSILVRISPPSLSVKSDDHGTKPKWNNNPQETFEVSGTSSCESSDYESQSSPNEGRRARANPSQSFVNLVLRYRIEWSSYANFEETKTFACTVAPPIRPNFIIPQLTDKHRSCYSTNVGLLRTGFYDLLGLKTGQPVYIRVYAFSLRGWSEPRYAQPLGIAPSSWYDVKLTNCPKGAVEQKGLSSEDNIQPLPPVRFVGNALDDEFNSIKQLLDQQIVLWTYRQSVTGGGGESSGVSAGALDEPVRKTKSPKLQRKRSFRFLFTPKNLKFVKQTKSGVYLAILCHNSDTPLEFITSSWQSDKKEKSQILLADDFLPMVQVTREEYNSTPGFHADVHWFAKLISDSTMGADLQLVSENLLRFTPPNNLQLRVGLLAALHRIQISIGNSDVGTLYPELFCGKALDAGGQNLLNDSPDGLSKTTDDIMETSVNMSSSGSGGFSELSSRSQSAVILVLVKHVKQITDFVTSGGLKWCSMRKFLRQNKITFDSIPSSGSDSNLALKSVVTEPDTPYLSSRVHPYGLTKWDAQTVSPELHILISLDSLIHFSQYHSVQLTPGLYLAYIQLQAHLDQQPTILLSRTSEAVHMLPVEKIRTRSHVSYDEWAAVCNLSDTSTVTCPGSKQMAPQSIKFLRKLTRAWLRFSRCLRITENETEQVRIYLPEVIQLSPKHSLILIFPPIDKVCLPPSEVKIPPYGCFWSSMSHFERNMSMTYDPVFQARMFSLTSLLEFLIPVSAFIQRQCITDTELSQCAERTAALQSIQQQIESYSQNKRWLSEAVSVARDKKTVFNRTLNFSQLRSFTENNATGELSNLAHKNTRFSELDNDNCSVAGTSRDSVFDISKISPDVIVNEGESSIGLTSMQQKNLFSKLPPGLFSSKDLGSKLSIIRIFADYPTGLALGTSVKMLVSLNTTAKDIVDLVVTKLADVVERKRGSLMHSQNAHCLAYPCVDYNTAEAHCLTISVGNVERLIPNTLRPLLLQDPWRSGRFAIRLAREIPENVDVRSNAAQYLCSAPLERLSEKTHSGNVQPLSTSVRSVLPDVMRVPSAFHFAKITPPPRIYLDGRPIE
ncbi:unnamed protein product [Calicophoron daubneyi]|uniref:Ras-associating domain-containing protein n=1 Tax=Calicophoron daubneyi TaxID=300641 RepID=A0AAV2TEP8_CALDB